MHPTELRARRLALGLGQRPLANLLNVKQNTIHRWETGTAPIPPGIATDLERLEGYADDLTDKCQAQAQETGTITVPTNPDQPLTGLLLVAAARAAHKLRKNGTPTTITEQTLQTL